MAIGKALRFEVLRRDGHRCRKCGRDVSDGARLVVDHVVAVALGGLTIAENLETLCTECNVGKSATPVNAPTLPDPSDLAQRWMRAMAAAVEMRRSRLQSFDAAIDELDRAWLDWYVSDDPDQKPMPRPENWRITIERYLSAGVPVSELIPMIRIAMTARLNKHVDFPIWSYFIGCCKRVLQDLETQARSLMDAQDTSVASATDEAAREPTLDDLP